MRKTFQEGEKRRRKTSSPFTSTSFAPSSLRIELSPPPSFFVAVFLDFLVGGGEAFFASISFLSASSSSTAVALAFPLPLDFLSSPFSSSAKGAGAAATTPSPDPEANESFPCLGSTAGGLGLRFLAAAGGAVDAVDAAEGRGGGGGAGREEDEEGEADADADGCCC